MKNKNTYDSWEHMASRRRLVVLALVLIPTGLVSAHLARSLPSSGATVLEAAVVLLFACLFAWISFIFWIAAAGLLQLSRHFDRFSPYDKDVPFKILKNARTAVIMPIFNENVGRVSAGVEVIYRSLAKTGHLESFDFFILSDSTDPDTWVSEEIIWADLCYRLDAFGRLYYRHRKPNIKRKSGNIADFCRRWGYRYQFMVVLDADSIITGRTLVHLVQTMIAHPKIGILQTFPAAVNQNTLLARLQQFSNHVYGPMLAAGLSFLQFGDAQYWGHNAIIRVRPFMQFCGLPKLSGRPPLGGEILSHDFVESALMRRAGFEIWLTYNTGGSYEEVPPTLIGELQRDRRWCQGNLQHLRLIFAKGLFSVHRALFLKGALSYGSALLWFSYLSISTILALWNSIRKPDYFPEAYSLFPHWPDWQLEWAVTLMSSTVVVLFLPKILAAAWIVLCKKSSLFGGTAKLLISLVIEILFAALLAPIRMLFHSKFVVLTFMGKKIEWTSQSRDDQGTGWHEALRMHASGMVLALTAGSVVLRITPSFFWWLSPILIALLLSPLISVMTSRTSAGHALKKLKLLCIPEEIETPFELIQLRKIASAGKSSPEFFSFENQPGFIRAVVDPVINDLHLSLLGKNSPALASVIRRRDRLMRKAIHNGPDSLSLAEKNELLQDSAVLTALHKGIWEIADPKTSRLWGLP